MAGPTTEILDSDLKDLRADFHRLEVGVANSIAGLERSVNSSIAGLERSVSSSIARVELAQAKQEAVLGVFRAIVLGTAGAAITGVLTTVWSAGATSSKISAIQSQVDRLENRLDRIDSSINRLMPPTEPPKIGPPAR